MKSTLIRLGVAAIICSMSSHAAVIHRYSFNEPEGSALSGTEVTDSVGNDSGVVLGNGAYFSGHSIILPGTSNGQQDAGMISAYIDLPNGMVSSLTDMTIEIWAAPLSGQAWQRLFDFGRTVQAGDGADGEWTGDTAPGTIQSSDGIFLSFQINDDLNQQRLEGTLDGAVYTLNSSVPTVFGVQYHYVITFESGVGVYPAGGLLSWYRDGNLIGSLDLPYTLSQIEDVNNWLGRSQWSADRNSHVDYNEFRVHDVALSASEIAASFQAGPELGVRYRWSFGAPSGNLANGTVLPDRISGASAYVRGTGATGDGGELLLPGTSSGNELPSAVSAYVDLPNGIISALDSVTVEAWATPIASRAWQRLFDFGNANAGDGLGEAGEWTGLADFIPGTTQASDEFALTLNVADDLNTQRLYGRLNYDQVGGLNLFQENGIITSPGQQYHYVVTYEQGVGDYPSGGRQRWYRDGELIASQDLPYPLSAINDVNNWLGRSQFSTDEIANAAFDEFRIYSFAFRAEDVAASGAAGPDTLYAVGAPAAMPDSVIMHPGQKARINVLDNDEGLIDNGTVLISTAPLKGSASVDDSGRILYINNDPLADGDSFSYTVSGIGGVSAPATVTLEFSDVMRIANPFLAMPEAPPATFYELVDAFPGLTFSDPISMTSPPGDPLRLFVCERMAQVQLIPDVTATVPVKQEFLNMHEVVDGRSPVESIQNGPFFEDGLMGLAFHPGYATNGYFYVTYTVLIGGDYYLRLSRFEVDDVDPNLGDPASELILLEQLDEENNHNGGDIHFGPDGYLYLATGDEGGQRDPNNNSQQIDKDFFCGIFRLDVDRKAGSLEPNPHPSIPTEGGVARFAVPPDNPFIHTSLGGTWDGILNGITLTNDLGSVRTEFWAHGFRHAWRMSFDPLNSDLWVGDVGQDAYEEINLVQKGGNYGWVYREGNNDTGFRLPVPAGFSSIDPVYVAAHTSVPGADPKFTGNSIVGGYVYHGSRFPDLQGHYLFCDSVTGHVWARDPVSEVVMRLTGLPGAYGVFATMGIDPSNQDILFSNYIGGRIYRLGTGESSGGFPQTLSDTGLFADLSDLAPNPGLLSYDLNVPFWSDYAVKSRWFAIPDGSNTITWSRDENWTVPAGMLWMKHFDLELTRGDPATKRRLETRVLVKTETGAYGVSYQWNEAGTEAVLVPDGGVEFDLEILDSGVIHTQRWNIPSRSSCLTCHTQPAGHVLGFRTRQLNRIHDMNGFMGNQLELLDNGGYLANQPEPYNVLPRYIRGDEVSYPVEERVRSYIAVNCAYCHQDGGTATGSFWDGRPELILSQTAIVNGPLSRDGGDPANRVVVPGDLSHSVLYSRMAATNGFTRMPFLATSELDYDAMALVSEWIEDHLPLRENYDQWRIFWFGDLISSDGEPDANPDGDKVTNWEEYISGTLPLDPASYLVTQLSVMESIIYVEFAVPDYRSAYVETATNLNGPWERWNVPGNDGIMRSGGIRTFTGPINDQPQFFRLRMGER